MRPASNQTQHEAEWALPLEMPRIVRPVKLTLRALASAGAFEPGVDFPAEGVFLVPAELAGVPIAEALRASLAGGAAPIGGAELALDFEVSGERFRAWRCWPGETGRGKASAAPGATGGVALALLGRPTGSELTEMEVIAEGPGRVAAELQRLAGAGSGAAGVVVAPWSRLAELFVADVEAARGVARGIFPLLSHEVEPVSRTMGGRIRELLLSAHDLLRQATERLSPDPADTLTPDDLVARRDEIAASLERAGSSSGRLVDGAVHARKIVAETRRRKDLVDGYTRAEDVLRKLELRNNLMAGNRRRLERARRAAQLADTMGLRRKGRSGPRVDPRVREQAEAALATAREEAGAARRALDAEEDRSHEREAVRDWLSRLEALRPALARLDEARDALAQSDAAHVKSDALAACSHRELESSRQVVAALEAEGRVLSKGPAHLDSLRVELRAAEMLRDGVRRLADVREQLRLEARELQQMKLLAEQAEETVEAAQREMDYRARSAYAASQPEPTPSVRELVAARDRLAAAAAAKSDVLVAVREDLRQLTTSLGAAAYREPALLEASAREKAETLAKWGQTSRSLADVQADLAEAELRVASLIRDVEARAREADARAIGRQQARTTLREREGELPENLLEPGQLDAALDLARADLDVREAALSQARETVRRAEGILSACEAGLAAARDAERVAGGPDKRGHEIVRVRDGGFDSWEDFEEARLSPDELTALEEEVGEHDDAVRSAEERQRIGQDQAALPRPDLPQVETLASLVEHARDEAQAEESRLAQEVALIDGWLDGLDDVSAELAALEESAGLGRRGDTRPSGTFEQRVHEALMRALLARAEGRLARWQHPWTLAWRDAPEDAARHLEVRDAESDAPVALNASGATLLALALALEMAAIVQEKRRPRLETVLLDAVPRSVDAGNVGQVLIALREDAKERPIAIAADARAWELLAPLM